MATFSKEAIQVWATVCVLMAAFVGIALMLLVASFNSGQK